MSIIYKRGWFRHSFTDGYSTWHIEHIYKFVCNWRTSARSQCFTECKHIFYWRPVIHHSRLAVSNAGASLTLIRFSTRTYLVCYWPILLRSFQLSQLLFALLHLDCCIALIKQYLMLICREWFPTLLSPSESNNIALLLSWLSICLYPCSASECLVQSIGPICLRLILIGNTFQILK